MGALDFSQQAVNRLAPAAGFTFAKEVPLPERLKQVQARADQGDRAALAIFETIGTYLGYTVAHDADYYEYAHLLILGRVTSGQGGEVLFARARETLRAEFPALAERIALHVPDEEAAASARRWPPRACRKSGSGEQQDEERNRRWTQMDADEPGFAGGLRRDKRGCGFAA